MDIRCFRNRFKNMVWLTEYMHSTYTQQYIRTCRISNKLVSHSFLAIWLNGHGKNDTKVDRKNCLISSAAEFHHATAVAHCATVQLLFVRLNWLGLGATKLNVSYYEKCVEILFGNYLSNLLRMCLCVYYVIVISVTAIEAGRCSVCILRNMTPK